MPGFFPGSIAGGFAQGNEQFQAQQHRDLQMQQMRQVIEAYAHQQQQAQIDRAQSERSRMLAGQFLQQFGSTTGIPPMPGTPAGGPQPPAPGQSSAPPGAGGAPMSSEPGSGAGPAPQGSPGIPPYQPMPDTAASQPAGAPAAPGGGIPPAPTAAARPALTYDSAVQYFAGQGLSGMDLFRAMQEVTPQLDAAGKLRLQEVETLLKTQVKPEWVHVELPMPNGGKRAGFVNKNAPNPMATFVEGGNVGPKMELSPAGTFYNPISPPPSGVIADPNKPFSPPTTPGGGPIPNLPFQNYEVGKARAGAPSVSVNTEKSYGGTFAGKIAEADVGLRDVAQTAPQIAERANRIKQILAEGNVATGMGAQAKLAIGRALSLAGMGGDDFVANTETLSANLARNTLDAIKASGLGAGNGFSNADRDFLEKAQGGKVDLNAATINRLADISHSVAVAGTKRWGQRVKEIPRSAIEGTGISTESITVPPLFAPPKPGAKTKAGAPGQGWAIRPVGAPG